MAELVKNLPAMWETWVPSLGWEHPLEKGKAPHSNILAWRIPENYWRRERVPTPPVFLGFPGGSAGKESARSAGELGSIPGLGRSPGEGNGSPLQYSGLENPMDSPQGGRESDTTERLLSLLRCPGKQWGPTRSSGHLGPEEACFPHWSEQQGLRPGMLAGSLSGHILPFSGGAPCPDGHQSWPSGRAWELRRPRPGSGGELCWVTRWS